MKKILALLLALVSLLGVIPYYLGGQAQQTLGKQHQVLSEKFYVDIVSRDYQRGVFSSTETVVVRLHPEVLSKIQSYLPDNIKNVVNQPITIVHHIKHGLFADGVKPVRAVVESEFQYEPDVAKILARFFGQSAPVAMRNVIDLNGSGEMQIAFANLDYEELSGIKINWQDVKGVLKYQDQFVATDWQLSVPVSNVLFADKGSLNIQDFVFKSGHSDEQNDYFGVDLSHFEVKWNDSLAYHIRLNDLVNLLTDLQVGAFINPNGNIAPNHIVLNGLHYQTQSQNNKQLLNTQGIFSFGKLQYGEDDYGPLNIDFSLDNIDAKSLAALKQRWQQIAVIQMDAEQAKQQMLAAIRQEGAGIFTNNPLFTLNKFEFKTPDGEIHVNGKLTFKDLQAADLYQSSAMVKKIEADFQFNVAKKLLESFAVNQARGLFAVEDNASNVEQEEINEIIKMLMNETINSMKTQGYLTMEDDAIQTHFLLQNNQITLNNQSFSTQKDEFDAIEAEIDADAVSLSASITGASVTQ